MSTPTTVKQTVGQNVPLPRRSIPDEVTFKFNHSNGSPRDVTDYDVQVFITTYQDPENPSTVTKSGYIVNPASDGIVGYSPEDGDFDLTTENGTEFQAVIEKSGKRHISHRLVVMVGDSPASDSIV